MGLASPISWPAWPKRSSDQPPPQRSRGFCRRRHAGPHAEGLSGNLLALGQRSLELVPSWLQQVEADSDLDCGHRPCGIVVPFRTAQERDAFPTAAVVSRSTEMHWSVKSPALPLAGAPACCLSKTAKSIIVGG